MADIEAQENELLALVSIYDNTVFEADRKPGGCPEGHFLISVELPKPFHVLVPRENAPGELEEVTLEHMPPVRIDFQLPANYPSESAPWFCVSCPWLTTRELALVCNALDRSWESFPRSVVLYRWILMLTDEAAGILELKSTHSLAPLCRELNRRLADPSSTRSKKCYSSRHGFGRAPGFYNFDRRCFKEVVDPLCLGTLLTQFNVEENLRVFNRQWITCQVCLTSKLGIEFELVVGCNHSFCRPCLREFMRIQIESGCTSQMRCPQVGCKTEFLPTQVTKLVGKDLGTRYEDILLSTYLDSQDDMTYCPRQSCQQPVVIDPVIPSGTCASCSFSFCVFCRRAYHGVQPCREHPGGKRAIRDEYLAASPVGKLVMEKRYGKRTLQRLIDEMLTEDWMEENSRKCPHCRIVIEKLDGCNKMTCWRCGTHFCWICMVAIESSGNPYEHFSNASSKCFNKLFDGAENVLVEVQDEPEFGEFL